MKRLERQKTEIKKQKKFVAASGISGSLSFLGSWQICHNLCLAVVAALSLIGISIVGMPLLFLTQYAVYFWAAAAVFLIPTLYMYFKHPKCMSKNLIIFNIGILIFSVPFVQELNPVFWAIGGGIISYTFYDFLKTRRGKKWEKLS